MEEINHTYLAAPSSGYATSDTSKHNSSDQLLNKEGQAASAAPLTSPRFPEDATTITTRQTTWQTFTSRKRYWVFASVALLYIVLGLSLGLGLGLGIKSDKVHEAAQTGSSGATPGSGSGTSPNEAPGVVNPDWAKTVPYFPSPQGGWVSTWEESYRKAAIMVGEMSLLEKVNVTTGVGWSMGPCVGNTGTTNVGFPRLCLQDGPLGIRFADYITAFPPGVTTAATWSKTLMLARATAMGAEARAKGVNVLLGPCIGPLGRHPTGGRNWEGFGSDPYLQGVAGSLSVRGIQSQGVIATLKHFIGNEQERFRQAGEAAGNGYPNVTQSISSNIGERALRELYAWPFAEAIRESPGAAMCSYNQVNNSYACQNSYLMNGVLKDELGFQGFVMSDWNAQHSGVLSSLSGLDMTMPGNGANGADGPSFWGSELTTSVLNGTIPEERLNDMVLRVVAAWYQMGQDNGTFPNVTFSSWTKLTNGLVYQGTGGGPVDQQNFHIDARSDHHTIAQEVAAEAITLLKNVGNTLPLTNTTLPKSILIFGSDAGPPTWGPNGCLDRSCDNGTLGMGWGSGSTDYSYLITPLEVIQSRVLASPGRRPALQYMLDDYNLGLADSLAQTPGSKCFVFVTSDSGEGYLSTESNYGDRNDLNLWHNGDQLIQTVANRCNDTTVVVHSVGAVLMEAWIDHPNVTAVLMAHLPSSESGSSLSNVLWGDINPSGHLPYTIGKTLEDYGPTGDILRIPEDWTPQDTFTEDLNFDYRYFDAKNITPRFDFGFGLSYTTFEYKDINITQVQKNLSRDPPGPPEPRVIVPTIKSNLPSYAKVLYPAGFSILNNYVYPYLTTLPANNTASDPYPPGYNTTARDPPPGSGGQGGNPTLFDTVFHVEVNIANTGKLPGQTVPQLYITFPDGIQEYTPPRQLRGFEKIGVGINETVTVGFDIRRKDISVWDESKPIGESEGWYIPAAPGKAIGEGFAFWVGQSSRGQGVGGVISKID